MKLQSRLEQVEGQIQGHRREISECVSKADGSEEGLGRKESECG